VDAVTPLAAARLSPTTRAGNCPQFLRRAGKRLINTTHHDSGHSSGMTLQHIYKHNQADNDKRLGRWLDRPLFPWKRLVVGFSFAEFALENWLLFRQYRVLQRTSVPKALNKEIDTETFDKSQVRTLIVCPTLKLTGSRHTVAQRPSSASSPRSSTKSSLSPSSISTSIPSSGALPVPS
jgi:hypothetical protein